MGERKVLYEGNIFELQLVSCIYPIPIMSSPPNSHCLTYRTKYYPPDFDPRMLSRGRDLGSSQRSDKPRGQAKIRAMAPFTMRCTTCGNFIYHGTKFNARKETVFGETYKGIRIFRFYIKCTRCSSEITFLTDPENSDYKMEHGAKRIVEGNTIGERRMAQFKAERMAEEEGNTMKALENRTLDSKMELDINDALDEIKALNARISKIDPMEVLEARAQDWEEADARANELPPPDEEEAAALEALKERELQDSIKRLEDDEVFDESEVDVFIPGKPRAPRPTSEVFKVPAPIKVKKSNKTPGGLVSVQVDKSVGAVRLKFQPKFRPHSIVPKSGHQDRAKPDRSDESFIPRRAANQGGDVNIVGQAIYNDDDDSQPSGGFSLVDY